MLIYNFTIYYLQFYYLQFYYLLFTIYNLTIYYLFIVRQSDEVGGQNGKHVCLDECHE